MLKAAPYPGPFRDALIEPSWSSIVGIWGMIEDSCGGLGWDISSVCFPSLTLALLELTANPLGRAMHAVGKDLHVADPMANG